MHTENKNTESFEQQLRERLLAFHDEPKSAAWSEIQNKLAPAFAGQPSYRFGKGFFFQTATAVIIAAVAIYFLLSSEINLIKQQTKTLPPTAPVIAQPPALYNSLTPAENKDNEAVITKPSATVKEEPRAKQLSLSSSSLKQQNAGNTSGNNPGQNADEPTFTTTLNKTDSIVATDQKVVTDTLAARPKTKSFYEKQRSDTSVKYRQLFISK